MPINDTTLKGKTFFQGLSGVYLHQSVIKTNNIMIRQSISLTEPNNNWLKDCVENKECSSKSELVNDLIRQARHQQTEIDLVRLKLEKAEKSGFTTATKAEILEQSKSLLDA